MNSNIKQLIGIVFDRNKAIMDMYGDGYTYEEISQRAGTTRNAVAGVIYRNRTSEPNPVKSLARKKKNQ